MQRCSFLRPDSLGMRFPSADFARVGCPAAFLSRLSPPRRPHLFLSLPLKKESSTTDWTVWIKTHCVWGVEGGRRGEEGRACRLPEKETCWSGQGPGVVAVRVYVRECVCV